MLKSIISLIALASSITLANSCLHSHAESKSKSLLWDDLIIAAVESFLLEPSVLYGMDRFAPPREFTSGTAVCLDSIFFFDAFYRAPLQCVFDSLHIQPIFASPRELTLDTTYTYFDHSIAIRKFFYESSLNSISDIKEHLRNHFGDVKDDINSLHIATVVRDANGKYGIVLLGEIGSESRAWCLIMYREAPGLAWRKFDQSIVDFGPENCQDHWSGLSR